MMVTKAINQDARGKKIKRERKVQEERINVILSIDPVNYSARKLPPLGSGAI